MIKITLLLMAWVSIVSNTKQAGIFAGDEGYDIDIAVHTELVGGLVTSTDKAEAEGQNRFATGTIASQDLENHAEYKGSAVSASGSMAANVDTPFGEKGITQSTKTKKDKAGNDVLTHGAESLQTGLVVGLGSDKDSQRSQTESGINTTNLVIRDEQAQLAKTGKTAEEAKAGLNTAITTDNAAAHSGKLENRFDKAKLQKELDYQVKATQEFQTITKPGIDGVMTQIAANKQAKPIVIAGGFGGGSELVGQLIDSKGDVTRLDLPKIGLSTITGIATKDMSAMGVGATNGAVEFLDAYRTGKNPVYEAVSSTAISAGSAKASGMIKDEINPKFNPKSNEYKFEQIRPDVPIYKPLSENQIPSIIGNFIDNTFNRIINNEINKNINGLEKEDENVK